MPVLKFGRKGFLIMFAALASLITQACSQAGLFVANAPTYFGDYKVQTDILYDPQTGQKLDVYRPDTVKQNSPVIVFLYGGRWSEGSKNDYRFVGSFFAQNGYVTVIPDYRKYPAVKFPAFVEDAAQAVQWVGKHIKPENGIVLSGHSAGAHMGALRAADERYLQAVDVDPRNITGFVGLAGPYSFTPEAEDLKDMFGRPENYPQMQVTTFIDGAEPPMLLLHGAEDETVKAANYEKLETKIKEQGGAVETHLVDGLGHVDIVSALTWIYRSQRPVDTLILEFLAGKSQKE